MGDYRVGLCIFAGGRSKRMGKNKMLLEYNGKKLYESVADRIASASPFRFLSTNASQVYAYPGWTSVPDRFGEGIGPINGIGSVMDYIEALPENDPQKCDAVLFCAGDMPYFDAREAKAIIEAYDGEDILVVYAGEKMQPASSIFSVSLLPMIRREMQQGNYRLRFFADHAQELAIGEYHSTRPECFTNVNTPEDAKQIRGLQL